MASVAATAADAGQRKFTNKERHKMLKAQNHALTQLRQKRRKKFKELEKQYKKKPETRPDDGGKAARAEISEKFDKLESELLEKHEQEVAAFEAGAAEAAAQAGEVETKDLEKSMASASLNGQSRNVSGDGKKKLSRYEKRKLKRLAEEAEADQLRAEAEGNVEARREVEKRQLQEELQPLGLTFEDIRADGHCLFTSIAHQLALRNREQLKRGAHQEMRQIATSYMLENRQSYAPFVEGDFDAYCSRMANTADWGGQIEIQALAEALKTPIEVYSANQPKTTMGEVFGSQGLEPLRLSYHKEYYALGEHYNSVVPEGSVGAAGPMGGL